jgi:hypothetical protein
VQWERGTGQGELKVKLEGWNFSCQQLAQHNSLFLLYFNFPKVVSPPFVIIVQHTSLLARHLAASHLRHLYTQSASNMVTEFSSPNSSISEGSKCKTEHHPASEYGNKENNSEKVTLLIPFEISGLDGPKFFFLPLNECDICFPCTQYLTLYNGRVLLAIDLTGVIIPAITNSATISESSSYFPLLY